MGEDVEYFRAGGSRPRNFGNFYRAVVQATLLFGAELWVISSLISRNLGSFHHILACCLAKIHTRSTGEGRWIYMPLYAATKEVGL